MYIATFFTHYGAQLFHKRIRTSDASARLMPVPRALSAACGICVLFERDMTAELQKCVPEDLEGLYEYDGSGYAALFEAEE